MRVRTREWITTSRRVFRNLWRWNRTQDTIPHHINLVRLRGFCVESRKRLLVYEYMNRGSLDRMLFGCSSGLAVLKWKQRLDIAPENILIHDHNQDKIADFGLAKLMSPKQSGLFTIMRGMLVYLAPEWLTNTAISDKTDVYSLRMVLLEIVRGPKNRVDERDPELTGSPLSYFPMLAFEMHKRGRYEELADPRLEGKPIEHDNGDGDAGGDDAGRRATAEVAAVFEVLRTRDRGIAPESRGVGHQHESGVIGVAAAALLLVVAGGVWAEIAEAQVNV
ncbi:hypothetical protein ZIOFF_069421 [Zingiber officinale]|uniref:Protein kinase domain-containing protein n=1 Tax=Zingiber officinale TaxID=94328 RepID=A0A8J5EU59_ZINOF|nr:hypothetical protein ZIOFF_069421 [Zingiber officinale]